jgi:hypothetical protein
MTTCTPVSHPHARCKQLRHEANLAFEHLMSWCEQYKGQARTFEPELFLRLCHLGTLLFSLFLWVRAIGWRAGVLSPVQWVERTLHTRFGSVTYQRPYQRKARSMGFALDLELGLHPDALTPHLASLGVRLATHLSFEDSSTLLAQFVPRTVSPSTLQKAALGMGAKTEEFFQSLPAVQNDGEVMVVMVDAKCIPTATEHELSKRRQPRTERAHAASARHRGRLQRKRSGPRRRRRPGDKAKNGKQVVVVVLYTLRREGQKLLGPLNKREYCVVGPKELGFQWARNEVQRRGFGPQAQGRRVQFISDGDDDLNALCMAYLPHAHRTLDVYHALEYVAQAGHILHGNDKDGFDVWFGHAKKRILAGKVQQVVSELSQYRQSVARTGPGTKGKRDTLDKVVRYLGQRVERMNYGELLKQDMDVGSGAVEGAVRHLVTQRFDQGGMRWIRERANGLLQLRCVEKNGLWQAYLHWLFDGPQAKLAPHERLGRCTPPPLPTLKMAA